MASYRTELTGDFDNFVEYIKNKVMRGSLSASLEEEMEEELGGVRCCFMTFERYSFTGGNRLSLSVTVLGMEGKLKLLASAAGGSSALLFKLNTLGEHSFLELLEKKVEEYRRG